MRLIVCLLMCVSVRASAETPEGVEEKLSPAAEAYLKAIEEEEKRPPIPPYARKIMDCYQYQLIGLLGDHKECILTLDNAGLLDRKESSDD